MISLACPAVVDALQTQVTDQRVPHYVYALPLPLQEPAKDAQEECLAYLEAEINETLQTLHTQVRRQQLLQWFNCSIHLLLFVATAAPPVI
jgi:hypothetical protein